MPEDAVMEPVAEVADPVEPAIVEPVADAAPDPVEDSPEGSEPAESVAEGEPAAPFVLVQDGKLSAATAKALEQIKATDPAAYRALRQAAFHSERLQRELPGDSFKELTTMRQTLTDLGGIDGLKGMKDSLDGWQKFDQSYIAGDPKSVDFMVQTPEGQDAFLKIAPHAFGKYAELHPEGYRHYVAGVVARDMVDARIPLALERLQDFIGDDPRAKQAYDQISKYVNSLQQLGSNAPELPKREQANPQAASLEERERNLTYREWVTDSESEHDQAKQKEWARLTQGRTVNEGNREAIEILYGSSMDRLMGKSGEHAAKLQAYIKAGDREGFRRFTAAIHKNDVPRLLEAAFNKVMGTKPGPKPAVPAPQKPTGTPAARPASPDAGWTRIAKAPATGINWADPRTNYRAGKAVLTDGKRVQWK